MLGQMLSYLLVTGCHEVFWVTFSASRRGDGHTMLSYGSGSDLTLVYQPYECDLGQSATDCRAAWASAPARRQPSPFLAKSPHQYATENGKIENVRAQRYTIKLYTPFDIISYR